jgi:hypothetical protein
MGVGLVDVEEPCCAFCCDVEAAVPPRRIAPAAARILSPDTPNHPGSMKPSSAERDAPPACACARIGTKSSIVANRRTSERIGYLRALTRQRPVRSISTSASPFDHVSRVG